MAFQRDKQKDIQLYLSKIINLDLKLKLDIEIGNWHGKLKLKIGMENCDWN